MDTETSRTPYYVSTLKNDYLLSALKNFTLKPNTSDEIKALLEIGIEYVCGKDAYSSFGSASESKVEKTL